MTRGEFAAYLSGIQYQESKTRESAQKEYAREEQNAFANFERIGKLLNLPREQVLLVYFYKHFDGILSHLEGNEEQRESIQGRILDARLYLALLGGMIQENAQKRNVNGEFGQDKREVVFTEGKS